ncbi:MAG: ABC transporter, partial [Gammaproteobacteria bacterium]
MARLRHALVPLLLLAALVMLVRTLDQHNLVRDVSRDARNSLDPRSVAVLAELHGPVEAVALLP